MNPLEIAYNKIQIARQNCFCMEDVVNGLSGILSELCESTPKNRTIETTKQEILIYLSISERTFSEVYHHIRDKKGVILSALAELCIEKKIKTQYKGRVLFYQIQQSYREQFYQKALTQKVFATSSSYR